MKGCYMLLSSYTWTASRPHMERESRRGVRRRWYRHQQPARHKMGRRGAKGAEAKRRWHDWLGWSGCGHLLFRPADIFLELSG